MGCQKGYTAIEALIWTVGTTLACGLIFGIYLWVGGGVQSQQESTQSVAMPTGTTTVPQSLGRATAPVVHRSTPEHIPRSLQTIELRCDGDCGAALEQFRILYQECEIIPAGNYDEDGQTVSYYFYVGGAQ